MPINEAIAVVEHRPPVRDIGAGVSVERSIALTGRCLCGRRPTVRDRMLERLHKWLHERHR